MFINMLKNSSSLLLLISSFQRSLTLLALFVTILKIACLHVSFTAYENFYKLSKNVASSCLLSTFSPSEVSKIRNSTIKHISRFILTGFYPSPKSFWSCTHVNSCQKYILYINLHILLNILSKIT